VGARINGGGGRVRCHQSAFASENLLAWQDAVLRQKDRPMTSVPTIFSNWLGGNRVAALAERVAGRSRLAAWQRVHERVYSLSPGELRGYVRARAIGVVKEETQRLIEQEGDGVRRRQTQIEEAAVTMLVELIAAQAIQARFSGGVRRAA
jgi:hypothetical protein